MSPDTAAASPGAKCSSVADRVEGEPAEKALLLPAEEEVGLLAGCPDGLVAALPLGATTATPTDGAANPAGV